MRSDSLSFGFTGTRNGMTEVQIAALNEALKAFEAMYPRKQIVFHSGDCVGADKQAWEIACRLGYKTVGHIPVDDQYRAFCSYDEVRRPMPYMDRNRAIVKESSVMLAAPAENEDQPRGGTWATIRMAATKRMKCYIIWPDGRVEIRGE